MPLVSFCLNNNEEVNNSKHVVKKILVNGCCNTVESLKDKWHLNLQDYFSAENGLKKTENTRKVYCRGFE